jgi:predicted alpha-1,2-mannosidase
MTFDTSSEKTLRMRVGISYVSADNALSNLRAEVPDWDFDRYAADTRAQWNQALGEIEVEGGTDAQRTTFYTGMYHAHLAPNVFSDANGDVMGFDGQVRKAVGYTHYANYSLWDVYRSWVQLLAVLEPERMSDMVRSLVQDAVECGALPLWPMAASETATMVGDPGAAFVASAYAFGARGFDAKQALAIMVQGATDPASSVCGGQTIRTGLADYLALGYCPADGTDGVWGPVSTTLEYAVADFAIARLAEALGQEATATAFYNRALNWKNVFNPATGYMQGRLKDGSFVSGSTPATTAGYVEGTSAQYTFFVPHDVPGLATALGGPEALIARLDEHLQKLNEGRQSTYYYIGNEPAFSTPWAYGFVASPWKTQEVTRRILNQEFSTGPGGLPGNDDLGATSSWAIWSAIGLYPAAPGVGGFVVGSPLFRSARIHLGAAATVEITTEGADAQTPYIQSATLGATSFTSNWVTLEELRAARALHVVMGATPDKARGSQSVDRPPSFFP